MKGQLIFKARVEKKFLNDPNSYMKTFLVYLDKYQNLKYRVVSGFNKQHSLNTLFNDDILERLPHSLKEIQSVTFKDRKNTYEIFFNGILDDIVKQSDSKITYIIDSFGSFYIA